MTQCAGDSICRNKSVYNINISYTYIAQTRDLGKVLLTKNTMKMQDNVHIMIDFSLVVSTEYSVYQLIFNCKHQLLRIELNQIIREIWKYILVNVKTKFGYSDLNSNTLNNITQDTLSKFHFVVAWSPSFKDGIN